MSDELRRKTFARAIKLLAAKPRSVAELRERLLQGKGVRANKSIVEIVIARLRSMVISTTRSSPSVARLRKLNSVPSAAGAQRDLKHKQIENSVADEALELVYAETPEEQLIDRAIEKRIRLRGRPKNRAEAKSLFDHLLRQGFGLRIGERESPAVQYTDDQDEC